LNLKSFVNLQTLLCSDNQLANLNFLNNLDPEKLESLHIGNNDIAENNLTPFIRFTNLESLYLGNHIFDFGLNRVEPQQENFNCFSGSLEPLKNLTKLEYLDISNTDIDRGLEYLPESVKYFRCSIGERPWSKAKSIRGLLAETYEEFKSLRGYYINDFPQKLLAYKN
jgi:Leucine-rich repeat (LRR) protein